jgi:hypothetical protein
VLLFSILISEWLVLSRAYANAIAACLLCMAAVLWITGSHKTLHKQLNAQISSELFLFSILLNVVLVVLLVSMMKDIIARVGSNERKSEEHALKYRIFFVITLKLTATFHFSSSIRWGLTGDSSLAIIFLSERKINEMHRESKIEANR